jgi:hypothetical protein
MKNKILVYDDNCPMCSWYSSLFVRAGLLPPNGRKAFSSLEPSLLNLIDFTRSRNEIPLLDTQSGHVLYGIDALLEILGQRAGFIKTVGQTPTVNRLLKILYKFISYNRNVIVARRCGPGHIDCAPDMSYTYRLLFMLVCLINNTLLLFPIHNVVLDSIPSFSLSILQLQAAHFSLVFINLVLAVAFNRSIAIEYLGQVNMLALLAILLIIPLIFLIQNWDLPAWLVVSYLGFTAVFIFKEYLRRMEYAGVLPGNKWIASSNLACMMGFIIFLFI